MALTVTFKYGGTTKTLTLHKWKFYRKSVRARMEYFNGGIDSDYRAGRLYFEMSWNYLSSTEYADIVAVIDQIRSGTDVYLYSMSGNSYFNSSAIPGSGLLIDLENDDVLESVGEWFENMPLQLVFVTREKRGLTHAS